MAKPRRIQRKRIKGWRMPAGAVYVGRPSPWGNPFPWRGDWIVWAAVAAGFRADRAGRRAAAVHYFRLWLTGEEREPPLAAPSGRDRIEYESGVVLSVHDAARGIAGMMIELLGGPIKVPPPPSIETLRSELGGRDLVCWCPLDAPCHADVLLEIANG